MAVYVIVIVLVALLLAAAYRTLGRSTPPVDATEHLLSLHALLQGSIDDLGALTDASSPRADAARTGRRVCAGIQQTLDRLPPVAEPAAGEADARRLLAAAAEDVAWAWRILEGEGVSGGLDQAVAALRAHAAQCCAAAEPLLTHSPAREPADRR